MPLPESIDATNPGGSHQNKPVARHRDRIADQHILSGQPVHPVRRRKQHDIGWRAGSDLTRKGAAARV